MRVQLATPENELLSPQAYNELFTMHGTTMIFLFNTPVFAGFANYLLPLQLGTRDLAFPRLNAFSYWVFLFAGLFMYASFLTGDVPRRRLVRLRAAHRVRLLAGSTIDFWGLGVTFVGISTTVGAVNFIVTIFKLRAPGMTLNRMPLFVWSMLVMAFMIIFAVPAVTVAALLLELDRIFGTGILRRRGRRRSAALSAPVLVLGPSGGVHLVPPRGRDHARRPSRCSPREDRGLSVGGRRDGGDRRSSASACGSTTCSRRACRHCAMGFFSAASQVIAIPSGVLYFVWIATIWQGRVRWTTPMLFSLGFLVIFLIGGITGVMVSVMPFDMAGARLATSSSPTSTTS